MPPAGPGRPGATWPDRRLGRMHPWPTPDRPSPRSRSCGIPGRVGTSPPPRSGWGCAPPGTEVVERVNVIREALIRAGHPEVTASDPDPEALLAVHSPGLIEHLRTIHDAWVVGGYTTDPGQDRVVPYVFPTEAMLGGLPVRRPTAAHARAGQYCYDTMTLIGPGTWDAVEAAAGAALTAVDLVATAAWVEGAGRSGTGEPGSSAHGLRAVPPAGPSRRARGVRRLVLPEQRGHRRGQPARTGRAPGGGDRHRRPPRQRDPGDLLQPGGRVLRVRARRSRARAGSRTSWASPTRPGGARARAPTATSPCRHAPATTAGSRPSGSWSRTPGRSGPTPWWCPSAWTQPSTTRRARCGSPATGCARPGILLGGLGVPTVAVQEGGYHLKTLGTLVADCLAGLAEGAQRAASAG